MMNKIKIIIKRYLLTGLLVAVPLYFTFKIITFMIKTMDRLIRLVPPQFQPPIHIPGLGTIITVLLLILIGAFAHNYAGRKAIGLGEQILEKIPFVRNIYSAIKQLTETIFRPSTEHFRRSAIIEYPRKGLYALVFITANATKEFNARTGESLVSVFLPTTPNPTSGYYLLVPVQDLIEVDITVEEAFKLIISAGMITADQAEKLQGSEAEEG